MWQPHMHPTIIFFTYYHRYVSVTIGELWEAIFAGEAIEAKYAILMKDLDGGKAIETMRIRDQRL